MHHIDLEARRRPNGTLGPVPIENRLWGRISTTADGCWEFGGSRKSDGYGQVRFDGRMQTTHRVAWSLTFGEIPDGLMVCHRCDNPPCINPAHLFLGTAADNNRDRQAKGRTRGLVIGIGAQRAREKTACPKGHPYSGDNVRFRPNGRRRCAACYRDRARAARIARRST